MSKILDAKHLRPSRKLAIIVYVILNIIVIINFINYVVVNDSKHGLACIKVMILFLLPWLVERITKKELPDAILITVQLFIFAAIILGEVNSFYIRFPLWDVMLHTLSGILCTAVGYMIFYRSCNQAHDKIGYFYIVLSAICFSMTIAVFWEFYEFGMDQLLNRDMQKDTVIHMIKSVKLGSDNSLTVMNNISNVIVDGKKLEIDGYLDIGLFDTMKDLLNNLIGSVIFTAIWYWKGRKEKNQYSI